MQPNKAVSQDIDLVLGQVATEFFERLSRGESPEVEEYVERYPEIADMIRHALPALQVVNESIASISNGKDENCQSRETGEKRLGDFRILRELGRGGMGVVYEAEQISIGDRPVALKVLPFAAMVDEKHLQRFRNEVRAVASLDHPNIVSVYSIGEERGVHFFAMQLIHGQSLAELINDLRRLKQHESRDAKLVPQVTSNTSQKWESSGLGPTPDLTSKGPPETQAIQTHDRSSTVRDPQAAIDTARSSNQQGAEYHRSVARLAIQAAEALEHAHERGVIHRDIKPANLVVDYNANLFITDFGLAHMEENVGVTITGDLIGTLRYMSPEQAMSDRVAIDHRTDIYSLGITVYELLTTRYAFNGKDRPTLLRQIACQEPTPLRQIDRAIPLDLETIVQKAMAKDPAARYFSAQELADDLQAFLDQRPISARPPSIIDKCKKWTSRNQSFVIAASSFLLLSTITLALSTGIVVMQRNAAIEAREGEKLQRTEALRQRTLAEASEQAAKRQALRAQRAADNVHGVNRFLTDFVFARADPANHESADQDNTFRNALEDATKYVDDSYPDDPSLRVALYQSIAGLHNKLAQYDRSKTVLEASLKLLDASVGIEGATEQALRSSIALGNVEHELGNSQIAERLLRTSLDACIDQLGESAPLTSDAMLGLARVLLATGKTSEAKPLAENCREIRIASFGRSHPYTAQSLVVIALTEVNHDRTRAKDLLDTAIGTLRDSVGFDDPETQRAIQALAELYVQDKEYADAKALYEELLKASLRVHGADHTQSLAIMDKLSDVLEAQGRLAAAETLLRELTQRRSRLAGGAGAAQTVERLTRVMWKQGKRVTSATNSLTARYDVQALDPLGIQVALRYGQLLNATGDYLQAEEVLEPVWAEAKKTLGSGDSTSVACLNAMIVSLWGQRRHVEADRLSMETVAFGTGDDTNDDAEQFALRFIALRMTDPWSVPMLRESLEHKRKVFSPDHPSIAMTLALLAQKLMVEGEFLEPTQLLDECLEIRRQSLPSNNVLIAEAQSLLGECYIELGDIEKAQILLEPTYEAISAAEHIPAYQRAEFSERLAKLNQKCGLQEKARYWFAISAEHLDDCLSEWKNSTPQSNEYMLALMARHAQALLGSGDLNESEARMLSVCAMSAINRFLANPYSDGYLTSSIRILREGLPEFYLRLGLQTEADRWRSLNEMYAKFSAETELNAHKLAAEIWQDQCDKAHAPLFRLRLSKAFCDIAYVHQRNDRHREAMPWLAKSLDIIREVRHDEPDLLWGPGCEVAALTSYAESLDALGRYSDAVSVLERTSEIGESITARGDPLQPAICSTATDASLRFAGYLASCKDPDYRDPKRAIEILQSSRITHQGGSLRNKNLALGMAYLRLNEHARAASQLEGDFSADGRLVRAMAYHGMGKHAEALFELNAGLANYEFARVNVDLSLYPWRQRPATEELLVECAATLELTENELKSLRLFWRGKAFHKRHLPQQAIATYRSAIDLDKVNADIHFALAESLAETDIGPNDILEAIGSVSKYIELKGESAVDSKSFALLALLHALNQDSARAFEAQQQAVSLDESHASQYADLAQILDESSDFAAATRAYELALKALPEDP